MVAFSAESFAAVLALVGIVIVVAALLSGLIERSNLPQVAVFLALGAVLGPAGLGLLDITLDSPILRVVATLSLALVLFTDAVSLSVTEIRRHAGLTLLVLGPGTLLSAGLIALAGWRLLGLPIAAAVVLGAALASTDPVLLRGLLRRPDLPGAARQALRLESGLNDVVLLPIVVAAMAFMGSDTPDGGGGWTRIALDLFVLGPGAGVLVGLLGVATLDLVRKRIGVRRDYESIYSLGICFTAFAAAEAVHGSGFLAAFMAGLTIAALDVELCDCFLEYGENTAEMALLFTFVLLGSSLIWSGLALLSAATLLFAALTILIRPVVFLASLAPTHVDRPSRFLIAWFGPRGLSSLLLVLLPVFAGIPGSGRIFSLCCLVVVFSVTLHGGSLMFLGRGGRHAPENAAREEDRVVSTPEIAPAALDAVLPTAPEQSAARDGAGTSNAEPELMTLTEMRRLRDAGEPLVIVDARSERTYNESDEAPEGALRLHPSLAIEQAGRNDIPKDAWVAVLCACPNDKTSIRVAGDLRRAGWPRARALAGGWKAWQAEGLGVVAKQERRTESVPGDS